MNDDHPIRPAALAEGGQRPLFSFVVVADTHINERDDMSSSPYRTNRLANDRARHVFRDIAAMQPQPRFVVHLGDIVHPVPSLPTFEDAVARFQDMASVLKVPLHVVPGNHDVGDKRIDWMPADQVCERYLRIYRQAFGSDYYSFDAGPLRLVAINSLLLNSGLPDEPRQREWLEQQIDGAGGRRVFLFMHYPAYVHDAGEAGSYDNVDEPARSWLLGLIARPEVEAVFAGHVHNFWYDRVGSADFYTLPSTAFLRHDFSEFYRIAPATEFGRGDAEKFGYFVVDVYDDGHVAYSMRTHGQQAVAGSAPARPEPVHLAHPRTSTFDRVGVELRHPWAESTQIPATGGVQEFGRKWARNDYPLLALWEMGARLSKVPEMDLADPATRRRMELMARLGHRYLVTVLGRPRVALTREQARQAGVIGFEVNAKLDTLAARQQALREWRETTGTEVLFSMIHGYDDSHYDGRHFNHFVKAGLQLSDLDGALAGVRQALQSGAIDGVTVRVEPDEDLPQACERIASFAEAARSQVLVSLKTSGPNLATERADDRWLAGRLAQAMVLSKTGSRLRLVFDTFMDVDRGYYPRHGFIDRRFDPRPAARAWATLTALLAAPRLQVQRGSNAELRVLADGQAFELWCCTAEQARARLALTGGGMVHDLVASRSLPPREALAALADEQAQQVLLLQPA